MIDEGLRTAMAAIGPVAGGWREGAVVPHWPVPMGEEAQPAIAGGGASPSAPVWQSDSEIARGEIARIEASCAARGRPALFALDEDDVALAAALAARGYRAGAQHVVLVAPVGAVAGKAAPETSTFAVWPPLAIQRQLWAEGEGGVAVNAGEDAGARTAAGAMTALLARLGDRAAGAGLVARHRDVALLHAIEVAAAHRRKGVGMSLARHAALWARERGARRIAAAVAATNAPAAALFDRLGFSEAGRFALWQQGGTGTG